MSHADADNDPKVDQVARRYSGIIRCRIAHRKGLFAGNRGEHLSMKSFAQCLFVHSVLVSFSCCLILKSALRFHVNFHCTPVRCVECIVERKLPNIAYCQTALT